MNRVESGLRKSKRESISDPVEVLTKKKCSKAPKPTGVILESPRTSCAIAINSPRAKSKSSSSISISVGRSNVAFFVIVDFANILVISALLRSFREITDSDEILYAIGGWGASGEVNPSRRYGRGSLTQLKKVIDQIQI